MHYSDDKLYFYMKKDASESELREIGSHLSACQQCTERLAGLSAMSSLFGSTMLEAPGFDAGRAAPTAAPRPVSRLRLAAAFALAVVLASFLMLGITDSRSDKKENAAKFIYSTYKTLYDYDYYQTNYIDKTDILQQTR
jgi:ferric-dicitrate binding protein FerR (iron transport regulator)